jgi:molybdate transport system regulatory protein
LTDDGRALLARFDHLAAALEGTATTERFVLSGTVVDRTGELVTVDTAAGAVRALALTDDDRVQVSLRADAITLQAPEAAPTAGETSARNRLEGTVSDVDSREATATVSVDVGTDSPLIVRVTTESVDRLGLSPGAPVVVTWKATATRATPVYDRETAGE